MTGRSLLPSEPPSGDRVESTPSEEVAGRKSRSQGKKSKLPSSALLGESPHCWVWDVKCYTGAGLLHRHADIVSEKQPRLYQLPRLVRGRWAWRPALLLNVLCASGVDLLLFPKATRELSWNFLN